MVQTVRARFTDGAIVPLEPLDIAEGQEFLITVQDAKHHEAAAEDAGLAQAIAEGLSTKPVSKQRALESLQGVDGA